MVSRLLRKLSTTNYSSVLKYGINNIIPRSIAILITLIITPLAIKRLGVTDYGLWTLATLIPNLATYSDFGITYGIVNEMSQANSNDGNLRNQRERLIGLARLLALIAFGWFIIGTLALSIYSFGGKEELGSDKIKTFTVLLLALGIYAFGISPTLWGRVQLSQQRGHEYLQWEGIGKTVSFFALLSVLFFKPNIYLLVIASLLPNIVATTINGIIYVRKEFAERAKLAWNITDAIRKNKAVFASGKYFFIFQVTFLFSSAIDPFIVNSVLGTKDVAYLTLARRPFDALPLTVTLFSTALWPVFHQLNLNNEMILLRRLLKKIIFGSTSIVIISSLIIIIFSKYVYGYLGQNRISIRETDLMWISLQTVSLIVILILNHYINAVNLLRQQMWIQIIAAGVGFLAKYAALIYGGLAAYFPVACIIYIAFAVIPMISIVNSHMQQRAPASTT